MEAMMQPSRVPILNSAAVVSATSGYVEPYYILEPDGEHGLARAEVVVRGSSIWSMGGSGPGWGTIGRRTTSVNMAKLFLLPIDQ